MNEVRLRDVVDAVGGGTPPKAKSEFYGGDIPWVTPKDMKTTRISDSQIRLTELGLARGPARPVPPASVLIVVRSGVLKHSLPVALTTVSVTVNQDLRALLPREGVDAAYLAHFLRARAPVILRWVRATTADNFPFSRLMDMPIPLPPVPEQLRIVHVLDVADALLDRRRTSLGTLSRLGLSIVEEEMRRADSVLALGDSLDWITSGSRGWARYYRDDGDLFLRIQNVRRDELVLEDVAFVDPPPSREADRTRVRPGDVLLSITADLGRTAVVPETVPVAYINQHLAVLRSSAFNPRYLSAALSSSLGQSALLKRNRQGVKAGLNFDDIRSVVLPCPPRSEQNALATRLASVDAAVTRARAHLSGLKALLTSLQQRAFTGAL